MTNLGYFEAMLLAAEPRGSQLLRRVAQATAAHSDLAPSSRNAGRLYTLPEDVLSIVVVLQSQVASTASTMNTRADIEAALHEVILSMDASG